VGLTGLAQVIARDPRDPPEPIAHGVGVDEQDPCCRLEPAATVEIGRCRFIEGFAGRRQRTIDTVDHHPAGRGVTGQDTLDQQLDLERDSQRALGRSADYKEGVAAFLAKRPANFTGR